MKYCHRCKLDKELNEFSRNIRNSDGLQSYCKLCSKELASAHYSANKSAYRAKSKERYDRLTKLVREHKAVPCWDCQVEYPYYVMQFDHVDPGTKSYPIEYLVKLGNTRKLLAEIAKCREMVLTI
jgi:hypothetical protein